MTPRERLFALEHFGIKLGLDNITALVDALDRPDRAWTAVHVAGTNGKGSVTAMVERGLRAAGHRTGRYTSPHLANIEERIAIDGESIDPDTFDRITTEVLKLVDELHAAGRLTAFPTFFEVTTAIAFEAFRRARVDAGVIEVGLGGRFDATNVIVPAVSAITSISRDHERHLGTTIPAIAREKAGIIKLDVPVVVGAMPNEARDVIAEVAELRRAPLVPAGLEYVVASRVDRVRTEVTLSTPIRSYPPISLGLQGAHQIANAVIAARTLETCAGRGLETGQSDVETALSDVQWPARLEWLQMPDRSRVLIDAAHNPAGALALAEYLRASGVAPVPIVIGVMKDKDVDGILRALAPAVSRFVATQVDSARALRASSLAERIAELVSPLTVMSRAHPEAAVAEALSTAPCVAVAGSIFLVGPLRARLIGRGAVPVNHPA